MRRLISAMNVSLDGFADHTVAVAADDEFHDFVTDVFSNVDTMLFGRVTYQLMESYWPLAPQDPKATKGMIRFADKINSAAKIVFSRTLENVTWNNSRLVKDNVVEEVKRLKVQPGKDLSVGGISICGDLARHGLIDEYWFMVQPVIWGKGKRLFGGSDMRMRLKLEDTKEFGSGVVALHYVRDER